jgi:hypothetical protein
VRDDKATVRRTACTALVELLLVCESVSDEEIDSSIFEYDVQILAEILSTRRIAAYTPRCGVRFDSEAGICLRDKNNPSVSTLNMVLEPEATCVTKAVELAERVVLLSILNADSSNTASATASQHTA